MIEHALMTRMKFLARCDLRERSAEARSTIESFVIADRVTTVPMA